MRTKNLREATPPDGAAVEAAVTRYIQDEPNDGSVIKARVSEFAREKNGGITFGFTGSFNGITDRATLYFYKANMMIIDGQIHAYFLRKIERAMSMLYGERSKKASEYKRGGKRRLI